MTLRFLYFLRPSPNISNYHFNNTVCIIEQDILRKAKCLVKIRILGSQEYHANRKTAKSMFYGLQHASDVTLK